MRQPAQDPLHRPRFVSLYFHFGVGILAPGIMIFLVRLLAISAGQPILRFTLTSVATIAIVVGVILVAMGAARSWGARGLVTSTLISGIVALLGSGVMLVVDSVPVPTAFTKWVEELDSDSTEEEHPAVVEAGKPIVFDEHTLRYADSFQHYDTWIQRHGVDAYDRHASSDPKRAEAARAFIRSQFRNSFSHPKQVPQKKLDAWVGEALANGASDPIVEICAMESEYDPGIYWPALRAAEAVLVERGDAPAMLFMARLGQWSYEVRAKPNEKVSADLVIEALAAAIKSGPLDEADAWGWADVVRWGYRTTLLEDHADKVLAAVEPLTLRHPWLKHFISGHAAMSKAFELPGYGLESAKNPLFGQYFNTAKQEFSACWDLNPEHPGGASAMISVAAAIGEKPEQESREWFDRATKRCIDYPEAYWRYRLSLNSYWRGKYSAVEEFAWECALCERYDTNVPLESLRGFQSMSQGWFYSERPFRDDEIWPDAKDIVDNYLWAETDPEQWRYWSSLGAIVAYRCGETDECRGYMEQLGYELNDTAADDWSVDADAWSAQIAAELGSSGEVLSSAQSWEEMGEYTEAIGSISAALNLPDVTVPARKHLESKLANLEVMAKLQQQDWKPMPRLDAPDKWETVKGTGTTNSTGTIEAKGELTMIMKQPVGRVFEVRGEIELRGTGKFIAGGFALGQPSAGRTDWLTIQTRSSSKGRRGVFLDCERHSNGGYWNTIEAKPRAPFHLRVIGERCLLSIDGRVVLDKRIEEPRATRPDSRLALLATGKDEECVVRWHSLEWRRP